MNRTLPFTEWERVLDELRAKRRSGFAMANFAGHLPREVQAEAVVVRPTPSDALYWRAPRLGAERRAELAEAVQFALQRPLLWVWPDGVTA